MTPTPMTPLQMVIAIVISAVITFSLRALPFVIFHGNRKMPKWLERIEKSLPAMIMSILIIYCLKDIGDNMFGVGIPRLLAVAITGGSYKLWHNFRKHGGRHAVIYGSAVLIQPCADNGIRKGK